MPPRSCETTLLKFHTIHTAKAKKCTFQYQLNPRLSEPIPFIHADAQLIWTNTPAQQRVLCRLQSSSAVVFCAFCVAFVWASHPLPPPQGTRAATRSSPTTATPPAGRPPRRSCTPTTAAWTTSSFSMPAPIGPTRPDRPQGTARGDISGVSKKSTNLCRKVGCRNLTILYAVSQVSFSERWVLGSIILRLAINGSNHWDHSSPLVVKKKHPCLPASRIVPPFCASRLPPSTSVFAAY